MAGRAGCRGGTLKGRAPEAAPTAPRVLKKRGKGAGSGPTDPTPRAVTRGRGTTPLHTRDARNRVFLTLPDVSRGPFLPEHQLVQENENGP